MSLAPDPLAILQALIALLAGPSTLDHLFPSIGRVLLALAVSTAIGLPLGLLASRRKPAGKATAVFVSWIRYLPPTAFIGLLVLQFGIGPQAAIALIVIGIAPYIASMSADAFRSVPRGSVEVATVFGASPREVFTKVTFPCVLPRLVDAVKVNVGAAWTFLVVAELIAGNSGIGYLIARAQRFANVQDLYALLLVCGLAGVVMDRILEAISRYVGRWDASVLH